MVDTNNSNIRILVVEDMSKNHESVVKVIQEEGYDIYTLDSWQEALRLLANVNVDIILIDINTPIMGGLETLKHIKDNSKNTEIPIIFLTDEIDVNSIAKVYECGAEDYITKPLLDIEVKTKVKNYLELKRTKQDLEEAYTELQRIAVTDPLTKLINRREMLRKIDYEIIRFERNKNKFSLIMADIDFFKNINDNYGHACGDFVIKGVADILRKDIRKQDFIARWGGEEFLLLLPETTQEGASVLAEKIRNRIEQVIFKYNGNDIKITMTFGVCDYIKDKEGNEIAKLAENVLCIGKENGRNCIALNS